MVPTSFGMYSREHRRANLVFMPALVLVHLFSSLFLAGPVSQILQESRRRRELFATFNPPYATSASLGVKGNLQPCSNTMSFLPGLGIYISTSEE